MARIERFAYLALPVLLWLLPVSAAAAPPPRDESIAYRIRPGQNLYTLASRYLMRREDYHAVQRLNRIADPARIPVGTTLRIPVRLLRSELLTARVLATRGSVRITNGSASISPTVGAEVPPGTVLETGPDGFIGVGLANGSQLSIPTRSRVRLDAMRRILLTNAVRFEIMVEGGKVETNAAPLPGGGSDFRLRTPRAVSAIRGTVLRVGYDPQASQSATEVLDGSVAVQGDPRQPPAMLPKGRGASISGTGVVTAETLLPAPDLEDPGQVLVDPVPTVRIKPLAEARGYHVQVAADAGFTDLVGEATADAALVPLPALADGRWFVRISALAASGLEGESQVYSIVRALTGLDAAALQDADRLLFTWTGSGRGRRLYRFQLVEGDPANAPTIDEPGLSATEIGFKGLPNGVYYWRVQVRQFADGLETENWTPFQKLTVAGMKQ